MKKFLSILLCLMLLMSSAALAETTLNGGEDRHISIEEADPNDPIDGVSPVTGRYLDDVAAQYWQNGFTGQAKTGRYLPVLVQIDNSDGGIGYNSDGKVTGYRAPWGVEYADVIYEAPLYRDGVTRLTFLFSDVIPSAVGPCRSARLFHAWLREEWDCCFAYYGQQEYTATNVNAEFKALGAVEKGILFPGTVAEMDSNPWKQYYEDYNELHDVVKPHHISANVAAMSTLIPASFEPANHTWLFTDEEMDGDDAEDIYVNWGVGGNRMYNSILEWNEDDECYERYMLNANSKGKETLYASQRRFGFNPEEAVTFNNIIVQFTKMEWARVDAPVPTVLGEGNADYFMNGKHMSGVWQRKDMTSRTVFYDEEGEEIKLQRGRTLIIVMDYESDNRSVSYE